MSGVRRDLYLEETRRFDASSTLVDEIDTYIVRRQQEGWELVPQPGFWRENPERPGILATFYWRRPGESSIVSARTSATNGAVHA